MSFRYVLIKLATGEGYGYRTKDLIRGLRAAIKVLEKKAETKDQIRFAELNWLGRLLPAEIQFLREIISDMRRDYPKEIPFTEWKFIREQSRIFERLELYDLVD